MGRKWQGSGSFVALVAIAVLCGAWSAYAVSPQPSITGVTITPDPAFYNTELLAVPEGWFDAQGDPEGYLFQWQLEGPGNSWLDIPGATENHLHVGDYTRGDVVKVVCWPFDGVNTGQSQEDTITISDGRPTVEITSPLNLSTFVGNPLLVEGTATDDGTVEKVVLRFNGGIWLNVTGTTSWSRSINLPLGDSTIEARAKDEIGQWGPIASITVTREQDAPLAGILVPDDGSTTTGFNVLVEGDAHDNTGVDLVRVRVNGGAWVNANLDSHGDVVVHWWRYLPLVVGPNLIEARAKDENGLWGPIEGVTITRLGNLAPEVAITSPADGAVTSDSSVLVTGTASDDDTVSVVRIRINGVVWLNAIGTTSWSRNAPLALGANSIEARARDNEGVWGPIVEITVTRTP